MKHLSALLSSVIVASVLGLAPGASARECYIGEIAPFASDFVPAGWLPADGRSLPIRGNEALFSLLGDRFGGDGRDNFALPKLTGFKTANGVEMRYAVCKDGLFPTRD